MGIEAEKPKATFYVWAKVNRGSIEFVKQLIDRAGIVATPGVGFGKSGERYVRFALTRGEEVIEKAVERLKEIVT